MTAMASVVALVQVLAAFAYFTVGVLAWARKDGASWWAFRMAISFQCIRSAADCVVVLSHADVIPNEPAVWWHLFGALGGGVCFWILAMIMSRNIRATVSTWGRSQWEAMFQATMSPQVACDSKGRVIAANAACEIVLGWRPNDLMHQKIAVLVPRELRIQHEAGFARARESREEINRVLRTTAVRRNGSQFPAEISLSSWREEGKRYFIATIRNLEDDEHMGPMGPEGPQGEQGPAGPQGPQGPRGRPSQ